MSEINMSDEYLSASAGYGGIVDVPVFAGDADVNDSFYNFTNVPLASWFCLEAGFTTEDANRVGIFRIWDEEK